MLLINKNSQYEYEIKKSKFLSMSFKVENLSDAKIILDNIKNDHKKATHVVYALSLKNPFYEKFDDDGEPSKTAGFPILEVIKKMGVTNVLVVIVRYYGGTKLGAGGLIRAYSNTAKSVLDESELIEYIEYVNKDIEIAYKDVDGIKLILEKFNVIYNIIDYTDIVKIKLKIDVNVLPLFLIEMDSYNIKTL